MRRRRAEFVSEPSLIEVDELGVALGVRLEPPVEVEEILRPLLLGDGGRAIREAARSARLRVTARLESAPLGSLVAAPGDAEGREREQERGRDLEPALARRRGFTRLCELVRCVNVDVLGHDR